MKLRLGLMVGFGAGYYLGAKAGRERYVELNRTLQRIRSAESVDTATDKAKAVIDLTVERAHDLVDRRRGHNHEVELDITEYNALA